MTRAEKERKKRNAAICKDYKELRAQEPTISDNRIFTALAQQHGLTVMGVKGIVTRSGDYVPRRK